MRFVGRRPRNRQLTVAFTGLDGTGKSTQAEHLEERIVARGGRPVRIHHASTKVPGVRALKLRYHGVAIRLLKRQGAHVDLEKREPETVGGARALGSLITLYFLLGSFIKSVWYERRYRGRFLILDRCFLDDIVKMRWRFGENSRLSLWLMRIAPKPDVVFAFEGDPSATYERKKTRNCTYEEYLAKGEALDRTLKQAVEREWTIRRVDVEDRSAEEIQATVWRILREHQDARCGTASGEERAPRGATA